MAVQFNIYDLKQQYIRQSNYDVLLRSNLTTMSSKI
jgi:hypothetical protein